MNKTISVTALGLQSYYSMKPAIDVTVGFSFDVQQLAMLNDAQREAVLSGMAKVMNAQFHKPDAPSCDMEDLP